MKTVLIIGAGDFQLPLVEQAAKNYRVCLVAPSIDERFKAYIDAQCLCDVRDFDTILTFAREQKIDGVITDQTDIPVRTVAYVAEELGLPGIGLSCARIFTDKSLMRKTMENAGLPVLPYITTDCVEDALNFFHQLNAPVIVKPLDTQGSRGVIRVDSASELETAFCEARGYSMNGKAVVEKYVVGDELVIEGITVNGTMLKQICGDTVYFNDKATFSAKKRIFPSRQSDAIVQKALQLNRDIVNAFGLNNGITHGEYIIDGEEVYLIEIAARGGGVYISSDLIHDQTGLSVEEFLLDICLGKQPACNVSSTGRVSGYRAFYLPEGTVKAIRGFEEVKAFSFLRRHQLDNIEVGMKMGKNTNKTSRFALIISADSFEQWREYEAKVINTLHVEVDNGGTINDIIWE